MLFALMTTGVGEIVASTPTPSTETDPGSVSPGIGGFLAPFLLALACWLLFRSMVKHLRRVDRNAEAAGMPQRRRGVAVRTGGVSVASALPPVTGSAAGEPRAGQEQAGNRSQTTVAEGSAESGER